MFRAAVFFLDPRYNILLSEDDKQKARVPLSNPWTNIVRLSRDADECRESLTSSLRRDDELDTVLLKEKEKIPTGCKLRERKGSTERLRKSKWTEQGRKRPCLLGDVTTGTHRAL